MPPSMALVKLLYSRQLKGDTSQSQSSYEGGLSRKLASYDCRAFCGIGVDDLDSLDCDRTGKTIPTFKPSFCNAHCQDSMPKSLSIQHVELAQGVETMKLVVSC